VDGNKVSRDCMTTAGQTSSTRAGAGRPLDFRIPWIIKRNISLFALSQMFTGAGMQFAYGFGPLMVIHLTGSAALAGMMVALIGFSRFLIAYPVGRITDTYGRKPGIMLGLVLALVGAVVTGVAMLLRNFALLALGMLIFASGMNAAQQLRVAATDMFPAHHRAQALGYVALGSLVGLVLSPAIMAVTERLSAATGHDPLALPWLFLPALIIPGMFMILMVRPDPKEIGMNLKHYYPGHVEPERKSMAAASFGVGTMLRHEPIRLAIVSNCAAQGNMTIVMVLTSLVLSHHGYSLTAIAASHVFHTCGMFAFTIPLGRLADRYGHDKVMYPGVAVALIGAALVAFTPSYWTVTLGTFLVGLGWAGANVAATALIADRYESYERGRAIGVNESIGGGMTMVMALVTGPLIEWGGLPATGLTAVLITLPPLLMLVESRARNAVTSTSRD
jgi:MFS family permease